MSTRSMVINDLSLSLEDILGSDYADSVCTAKAFISGQSKENMLKIASEKVEFYPESFQKRVDDLIDFVGKKVCNSLLKSPDGAGTEAFNKATKKDLAPLTGMGFIRIGENGKVYLVSKSEHYHGSLGHCFPGFKLIDKADEIAITNITHNNYRGYITRLLEEELVRISNYGKVKDVKKKVSCKPVNAPYLDRVLNLQTGSVAAEAALKLMLSRFYKSLDGLPEPVYKGKIPVFIVLGNDFGGLEANYHGTNILAQQLRGMWPEFTDKLNKSGAMMVKAVKANDTAQLIEVFKKYNSGNYKTAGFFIELIMMNYGATLLKIDFTDLVQKLCSEYDTPLAIDEIQTCVWSPEIFLFKEYGLRPDIIVLGKGMPGGRYPSSRLVFNSKLGNLTQFGALVTNSQDEFASLSYLITIEFVKSNSDYIESIGNYYETELKNLSKKYREIIDKIDGKRHLLSIYFKSIKYAILFAEDLNQNCIDISVQTYKSDAPPVALTKLPLISSFKMVEFLIKKIDEALKKIEI